MASLHRHQISRHRISRHQIVGPGRFPGGGVRAGKALAALAACGMGLGPPLPAAGAQGPPLPAAGAQGPPLPAAGAQQDWELPLDGPAQLVRRFAPPAQRWAAGHRGVDLLAPAGSPVRAAGDGVVTFAGSVAGRPVVAVQHGELRTTYEPVVSNLRPGDRAHRGQVIGTLSPAPGHCLPETCLHWGLRRGADYLDPLALLGRPAVRLLPLAGAGPTARPQPAPTPTGLGATSEAGFASAAVAAAVGAATSQLHTAEAGR